MALPSGWRSWFSSIQSKLVAASTISFMVAILTLAVYWYQHINVEQERTETYFVSIARTLNLATKEAVITTNLPLIEAYVNQIHGSNSAIAQTTIFNEDNEIMFSHRTKDLPRDVERQLQGVVVKALSEHKRPTERKMSALGGAYLAVIEPIIIQGESWGTVAVTFSMDNVTRERNRLSLGIGSVVFLFVSVFVVTALYVRRILLKPILSMVGVTQAVAEGDLSARADVQSQDELGLLAMSFNQMIEELNKRIGVLIALHEVSSSLVAPLDLSERLETVVRAVVGLAGAACGTMMLSNDQRNVLEVVSLIEVSPPRGNDHPGSPQVVSEAPAGKAFSEGNFVAAGVVTIPEGVERWTEEGAEGYQGLMAVPLRIKGESIGVINLYFNKPMDFGREELVVLRDAANQAAVIAENARLYEGLQQNLSKLEQSYEQLRELDKMKSEFIAITSHELRTPLTAIKSYVQLLEEGQFGDLGADQTVRLGYIEKHVNRLLRLLDDLIDLARIDRKELEVETRPIRLGRLVKEVLSELAPLANEKALKIAVDVPEGLPRIEADQRRLVQVLNNLIGNAIKFTPERGSITVSAHRNHNRWVELSVTDTGPGISEEDLDRIFEPFVQVESALTRKHPGVGLGLAVCKGIIEAHGGTIVARSAKGGGTTISCTLPVSGD